MLGFWIVLTAIVSLNFAWWLWADRRLRPVKFAALWRSLLAIFIGGQLAYLAAFLIVPHWARHAHDDVPDVLLAMVFVWGVVVLPATGVITLLLTAGSRIVRWFRRADRPATAAEKSNAVTATDQTAAPTPATDSTPPALSRRQILGRAAIVAVPPLITGVGVAYGSRSLYDLHVSHVDIPIAGLPDHLEGVKIAHITDVHVGKFIHEKYLRRAAEMANALNADIHLLTGDLIDMSITDLPLALDFVGWLKPQQHLSMCEGNHDLLDDPKAFYAECGRRGVPILANAGQTLQLSKRSTPIQLLGLRWGTPGSRGINEQAYGEEIKAMWTPAGGSRLPWKEGAPLPVLLAHHPHAFDAAAAAGIPLTLSGHTHGGMLMLSKNIGPGALMYRYWSGLYQKPGANLYVANGVGCWFPVRVNARPEIACLTLRKA